MATLLEKVSFVGIHKHLTVAHRVKNDVCYVHHPFYKFGAFTIRGECDGEYTHNICKDTNCNMNSDHYDHENKIHYYHVCYHHTPKDISNGECAPLCVYRRLISVIIDGVVQT